MADRPDTYYGSYLRLDRLLDAQAPLSRDGDGRPAHDEMLFIVVHQAYELWFKQILHELDAVILLFDGDRLADRDLGFIDRALERVVSILDLLIQQIGVLETMTPLDFLEFRDALVPASGFQSLQFRILETRLGLTADRRTTFEAHGFVDRLSPDDKAALAAAEAGSTLRDGLGRWLARTPFVETGTWRFETALKGAVIDGLRADLALMAETPSLTDEERSSNRTLIAAALGRFDALFDEDMAAAQDFKLPAKALQAALFIMLYRDEPLLHLPFRILKALMDIDERLTTWRYRHAQMVERMIGVKIGTGGSSGSDYLKATTESHRVFRDLFSLSTFLVRRDRLPPLPREVRDAMGREAGAG